MNEDTSVNDQRRSTGPAQLHLGQLHPGQVGLAQIHIVLLVVVPVIVLVVSGFVYWHSGRFVETDNAYVKAEVVPISAEVSAAIIEVLVKENQTVSVGQILFTLNAMPFQLAVDEARARAAETFAELSALQASYQEKQANIELARKKHEFAKKELKRQNDLKGKNFVSESILDDLEHGVDVSQQQVQVLAMDLRRIAASLGGDANTPLEDHPAYKSAIAKLRQSELDLERVEVRAPVKGIVSHLPAVGQYVRVGNTVAALVANEALWVEANFSETDLTHVRPGQTVDIRIDTYPDYAWTGKVESISPATGAEFSILPAQNATGNWVKIAQRVPVRVALQIDDGAPQLRSGLSAVVEIDTEYQRRLFANKNNTTAIADNSPNDNSLIDSEVNSDSASTLVDTD